MGAGLTHEALSQNVNTKFQVHDTETPLELVEISEIKIYPEQEEFAIVLRGPLNAYLGQGTRYLKHEQLGEFELFIVPVAQDQQGFYYEAVFNRLRD